MRLIALAILAAVMAMPTLRQAEAQAPGLWLLEAAGLRCEIALTEQSAGYERWNMRTGKNCDPEMKGLNTWRFGNSGDQIVFQADGDDVAYANWRSNDFWEGGVIDENFRLTMRKLNRRRLNPVGGSGGGYREPTARQTNRQARRNAQVAGCKAYYGTNRCAQAEDLGEPTTGSVEAVVNMNVRFLNSPTSSVVGQLPRNRCVPVKRCWESLLDKQIWCDVDLGRGKSGWVLKEDEKSVYLRDGCG